MSKPLFYEPDLDMQYPELNEQNLHHILDVLRMKEGSLFYITDGKGTKTLVNLKRVSKKTVELELKGSETFEKRSPQLHIAISFTKNPGRIEWFLEKATEMGVDCIIPLLTDRSEKIHFKRERFQKILISAMLQSQQCYVPVLRDATGLDTLVQEEHSQKLIAWCGTEYERKNVIQALNPGQNALFLIGPEGDFTLDEVHLCLQNKFQPVTLGNHRLRTETAGLYVCTIFNAIQ